MVLYLLNEADSQAIAYSQNVTLKRGADGRPSTHLLTVYYNNLLFWREDVLRSVGRWQLETTTLVQQAVDELSSIIHNYLTLRKYPPEMVKGDSVGEMPAEFGDKPISCSQALNSLVQSAYGSTERPFYDLDTSHDSYTRSRSNMGTIPDVATTDAPLVSLGNTLLAQHFAGLENPVKIIASVIERYKPDPFAGSHINPGEEASPDPRSATRYPALFGSRGEELRTTFIIYQTRFAQTGGTTALNILYDILSELFSSTTDSPAVLLCNEDNHMFTQCAEPPDTAVVITGEWCHEVLRDHGLDYHRGRGIQYHLGFHHYRDMCAGHVAITDSQYLQTYLGTRILGAYYFSCPMTPTVESAFTGLLRKYNPHDTATYPRGWQRKIW